MKYVLITAARNEESNIERTIGAVVHQTVLPVRWVIVNDGSTDRTAAIIGDYAARYPWIVRLDMPAHRDRSFAAKAHCFNRGYESVRGLEFEVATNLDADVSFDRDYLGFLLDKFAEDPSLGVAGTIFLEHGYDSARDSFEGGNHVAGGCQCFRRRCFEEVGGYVPNAAGGVDWIAVTTARMKGWRTRSFQERRFFHHRSLGTAEQGTLAAQFSYGNKDYYLGNHPVWQVFRFLYRMSKRPFVFGGTALALGYLWAAARRIPRPVSAELMRFHRHEQMQKLWAICRAAVRLERFDKFQPDSDTQRSNITGSV
jgi:glycosyltransferase involved in cell wall biosynthesis